MLGRRKGNQWQLLRNTSTGLRWSPIRLANRRFQKQWIVWVVCFTARKQHHWIRSTEKTNGTRRVTQWWYAILRPEEFYLWRFLTRLCRQSIALPQLKAVEALPLRVDQTSWVRNNECEYELDQLVPTRGKVHAETVGALWCRGLVCSWVKAEEK